MIDSSPGRFPNRLEYDSLCVSRRFAGSATGWAGRSRSPVFELSATELRELPARTQAGAQGGAASAGNSTGAAGGPLHAKRRRELNGMDRQTLRDWVLRYNAEGVAGLSSRCSPGRPLALNEAQMEELRSMVLEGPDLERNKVGISLALRRSTGGDRVPLVGQRGRAHGRQAAAPASHDAAATAALSSGRKTQRPRRLINKTSPAW